jgi:hypothetical protein
MILRGYWDHCASGRAAGGVERVSGLLERVSIALCGRRLAVDVSWLWSLGRPIFGDDFHGRRTIFQGCIGPWTGPAKFDAPN